LTWVEIAVYALAATIYVDYLLGHSIRLGPAPEAADGAPEPLRSPTVARGVLAVAVAMHFADIGYRCARGVNPISSTPEAISLVAFLIAAGYLIASFRYRLGAAGAFAVPAALAALVLARVVPAEADAPRMGSLGRVHILLAVVGVAVFAYDLMAA